VKTTTTLRPDEERRTNLVWIINVIAVPQFKTFFTVRNSSFERSARQLASTAADHATPEYLYCEKCREKRSFFAVLRKSLTASTQAYCRPPLVWSKGHS